MARAKQKIIDDIIAAGGTAPQNLDEVTADQLEQQLAELTAKASATTDTTSTEAEVNADYSDPDDDGHRWKTVPEGEQVRVYLLTQDGRGYDTRADDESKGKAFLKGHAAKQ